MLSEEENKERIKLYKRVWAKKNLEKKREYGRKYRLRQMKENKELFKKKHRESYLKWSKSTKGQACRKKHQKKWREKNPEKIATSAKRYYKKNKDRCLLYSRFWRKNNPEKLKKSIQKRTYGELAELLPLLQEIEKSVKWLMKN